MLSTIITIGVGNIILVFLALPLMGVMAGYIINERKLLGVKGHVNILADIAELKWQWQEQAQIPIWQVVTKSGKPLRGRQIDGLGEEDAKKVYTIILLTGAAIVMVGHLILLQISAPAELSGMAYFLAHVVFMTLAAMAQYGVRVNGLRIKDTLTKRFAGISQGGLDYPKQVEQKIAALGQEPLVVIGKLEAMQTVFAREQLNWRGDERGELEHLLYEGLMGREPNLEAKLAKHGQMIDHISKGAVERIERIKQLGEEMARLAIVLQEYQEGDEAAQYVELLSEKALSDLLETGQWPELDQYLDGIEASAVQLDEFAQQQGAKQGGFDDGAPTDDPDPTAEPEDPYRTTEKQYRDAYKVFGLTKPYEIKVARKIWMDFSRKYNPSKHGISDQERDNRTKKMQEINAAKDLIWEQQGWK